ncbi:hypothetical protein M426DRAFT_11561 [Hypoxylon sp. CI-4A]|nr:hypothetical protein M426DRAFT_11561 [Hypoxylon sp. CI-4A]
MAAGIIEAIGVISGALGIIQFGINNFPEPDSVKSTIRITVGLDTDQLDGAGGDLPDVRLFDEAGGFLGIAVDPGQVEDGGYADISVEHNDASTKQGVYTLFSGNTDAICIAYATITLPSTDKYSWIGTWGQQCGASWYYSNVYVGSTGVKPNCMWLDGNNDQPQSGFQVHWPEFFNPEGTDLPSDPDDQQDKIDYFCSQQAPFKYYNYADVEDPTSITYWTINDKRSEDGLEERGSAIAYGPSKHAASAKFRRDSATYPRNNGTTTTGGGSGRNPHANRLVMSNSDEHTADELCESETSYGPDFVNVAHGKFCRMSDKTQWPVCDGAEVTDNCFNTDTQQLLVNGVSARDSPYSSVVDWTTGN